MRTATIQLPLVCLLLLAAMGVRSVKAEQGLIEDLKDLISPEPSEEDRAALAQELSSLKLRTPHGELTDEVRSFYEARKNAPAWTRLEKDGNALLRVLCDSEKEGIDPARLELEPLREALRIAKETNTSEARAKADVLLTSTFFRYAELLDLGQVNPKKQRWHIPDVPTELAPRLEAALKSGDFAKALQGLLPPHPPYAALRDQLKKLRELEARGGWTEISTGELLEEGSTGQRVQEVKQRLRASGELKEKTRSLPEEETFDTSLRLAVEEFQRRNGLKVDGKVGGKTLKSLREPVSERIATVLANLERWRWLPRELPARHVRVNLPTQQLEAWKDGGRSFGSAVVIGQPSWQTPIFQDDIEAIEVNPSWWVPRRIAEEEVISLLQEKPDWAEGQGFRIIDRESGESMSPDEVDWGNGGHDTFAIVQSSGAKNPLGDAKFVMKNRFSIYLHGTDAPKIFEEPVRTQSHGCVRVEQLEALAKFCGNSDAFMQQFYDAKDSGKRTRIALEKPVPVYVLYFSAFVDQHGTLRFAPDFYGHDKRLEKALRGDDDAPSC